MESFWLINSLLVPERLTECGYMSEKGSVGGGSGVGAPVAGGGNFNSNLPISGGAVIRQDNDAVGDGNDPKRDFDDGGGEGIKQDVNANLPISGGAVIRQDDDAITDGNDPKRDFDAVVGGSGVGALVVGGSASLVSSLQARRMAENDPVVDVLRVVSTPAQYTQNLVDIITAICVKNNVHSVVHFKGFASGIDFSTLPSDVANALLEYLETFDAIFWDGDDYNESSFTHFLLLLARRLGSTRKYPTLICIKLQEQIAAFRESYLDTSLPVIINCIEINSDIFDKAEELVRFKQIPLAVDDGRWRDPSFTDNIYLAMGTYFVHLTRKLLDNQVISMRNVACVGGYDIVYLEYLVDTYYEPDLQWHYFHCSRIKNNCVQEGRINDCTGANLTKHSVSRV